MRWKSMLTTAALWLLPCVAHAANVTDGSCGTVAGLPAELAIASSANAASKGDCLPQNDAVRPAAEGAELANIETRYVAWATETCLDKRCVGNVWANFSSDPHIFAGCGAWAEGGLDAMSASWHYWTIREVKFGSGAKILGDGFHWVVEAKNTRTGETVYLDGWTAASKARSWMPMSEAMPWDLRRADMLRSRGALVGEFGAPIYGGACYQDVGSLCDHPSCNPWGMGTGRTE